jgi:hypothetical protein
MIRMPFVTAPFDYCWALAFTIEHRCQDASATEDGRCGHEPRGWRAVRTTKAHPTYGLWRSGRTGHRSTALLTRRTGVRDAKPKDHNTHRRANHDLALSRECYRPHCGPEVNDLVVTGVGRLPKP